MNQLPPTPDQDINALQCVPPRPPDIELPCLEIVARSTLSLCQPVPDSVPAAWQTATMLLAQQFGFDVRQVPKRPALRMKKLIQWGSAASAQPPAPMFAPWRCGFPEALQQPRQLALPNASWVSTYVFGKQTRGRCWRNVTDIMLMSPLPGGCAPDDLIPQPKLLQVMIEAARRENRRKVTIVTDARRRNGIIMHLLLLKLTDGRDRIAIEVSSIENVLSELADDPGSADAMVVLPDMRGLVLGILSETSDNSGPWPMVWHERDACLISCEALGDFCHTIPLNVSLLAQALALAANRTGLISTSEQLARAAATLGEWGDVRFGDRCAEDDRVRLSDEDLIKTLGRNIASGEGAHPIWQAVKPRSTLTKPNRSPGLKLVHSSPASEIGIPAQ